MASPVPSECLMVEDPEDTVPLSEILAVRDKCLHEEELWALCRECCLLLEYVQDSEEMFQAVSITPETIGFDNQGNLCFLYLDSTDPEPLFLPPEDEDGSEKKMTAHLYSLGMTMLYAAEYNVQTTSPRERGKMSGDLSRVVGRMTSDNPQDRPSVDSVLTDCDRMLGEESSQDICADLSAVYKMKLPEENQSSNKNNGPTLAELNSQLEQGHVNGVPLQSWSEREGQSQDSDSELADVFSKGLQNNNSSDKQLVDPNLTQDGILYSASTAPAIVTPIDKTEDYVSDINHSGQRASTAESSRIADLLEEYTNVTNKLSQSGKLSDRTPVQGNPIGTPSEGSGGTDLIKTDHSEHSYYELDNQVDYDQLNCYHPKGLLVLEDDSLMSDSFDLNGSEFYLYEGNDMEQNRKMSQSQGVTLSEVLETKDGYLQEAELWAVCRESIKALQKLKKRLPAYISPDTLILREEGFISFKAIPDRKPLEVIFMAPELQEKGLLSQKTCLYGLAVTLRRATGKKIPESPTHLSKEMESLLKGMLNRDLDKRPPLTEVLAVCDDHEQLSEVPSSAICQFMFQDTATAMMENEAVLEMSMVGVQIRAAQQQAELMGQINLGMHGKHHKKPIEATKGETTPNDLSGNEVRSGTITSGAMESPDTSVTAAKTNNSAFKPISGSLSNSPLKGLKRVPSKYNSSATHFTPIVLQHSGGGGKDSPVTANGSDKNLNDSGAGNKETEVVRKLKELKENLMKPRNGHNKENEGSEVRTKSAQKNDQNIKHQEPQVNEKTPSQVSLETIAHLLQNQGQLAQLNMLAATIAQLLQSTGYSASVNSSQIPEESYSKGSPQTAAHVPLAVNSRLPSLDVPPQFQDQLVGQTVTMPIQTASGVVTNYPVHLQLQQDPRTGVVQLVPVGMITTPAGSRGSDVESQASSSRRGSASSRRRTNGGYSSGSASPHVRPVEMNGFYSLGRPPRGRVHNSRSKEGTRHGPHTFRSENENSLRKVQSEHNLTRLSPSENPEEDQQGFHSNGHQTGSIPNIFANSARGYGFPVYEGGYADCNSPAWRHGSNQEKLTSQNSGIIGDANRVSPTESQSSSPSPSKDSGVSGVNSGGGVNGNSGYKAYPRTDVTLMDRLLGHDSIKQQQTLQKVVGLLRESFAEDGCLEVGGEDYVMAEYITSLAGLKWETFKSAIEEKYPDLLWDQEVLDHLYSTVSRKISKGSHVSADEGSLSQLGNLDVSGGHVAASTPSSQPLTGLKLVLSANHSEGKMSSSSAETGQSTEGKSDTAVREMCYRYSPTPRGGLHRFNPSRNLYNQGGDTCTSDSTDTSENPERKRRYKKRHQLNRSKNSSIQSSPIAPLDQSNTTQESITGDSNHLSVDIYTVSPTSSVKTREVTPPVHPASVNNSIRDQSSPSLPRLSEKSSGEEAAKGRIKLNSIESGHSNNANGSPVLYSVGVGALDDTDDIPQHFTSTPSNMAQMRAASMDREESFQNGHLAKQLSYELDNSSYQEGDDVFVRECTNGQRRESGTSSLTSQSNSHSEKHVTLNGSSSSQNKSSGSSSKSDHGGDIVQRNRGNVVYHSAELQYCMSPQLEHVIQELDPQNKANLESRKAQLDQQVMMERRTKKKMQQFYKKLIDGRKPCKGDHKSMLTQVSKDIKDMTNRLKFMELAWGHVEMLLTELHGISPALLHSLVDCPMGNPLVLNARPVNPLLQYQIHRDSVSGVDVRVLHAGTPEGLMSYLYTLSALADGYVHQFLYTFRYFTSQHDLLDFLRDKYVAAKRNPSDPFNAKVMLRSTDLLYFWLEGYYTVDFERDVDLTDKLQEFIINEVTYPEGCGATLLGLLQDCHHGNNTELSFSGAVVTDQIDLLMRQDDSFSPKKPMTSDRQELQGFKAIMKSSPLKGHNPAIISTACLENRQGAFPQEDVFFPHTPRRSDAFTLTDHSSQSLAEQLCLIQQSLFQKCHPVHYLNSKAQGIGVAMVNSNSKSLNNRSMTVSENGEMDSGLFVGTFISHPVLQRLIKLGQEISHWVAAEIVSCSSIKSQMSVLTKLIHTAQMCMQMRNFATCVAISDGLENLIVRQLPVWKNLPTKCISIKEELASIKMLLKNEPMCLLEDQEFRDHPTIPSILLFLMHVQQLEIGGFRLANGMFRWPKLRSLAQIIDQIRMFKDQTYQYDLNDDLQDALRHRIYELSCQDLQELASQHDTNYHKVSSRNIFTRMKGKFQNKGEKS